MAMTSPILTRSSTLVNSGVRFLGISSNQFAGMSASELSIAQPMPDSGSVKNFYLWLTVAPGVGTSWTFTILKNAVATAIVLTISDTGTFASDTTNTVTYVQGDRISVQITPTATPAVGTAIWSIDTVGAGCPILTGTSGTVTVGAPEYASLQASAWQTSITNIDNVMPTAGTLGGLSILGNVAAGAGNTTTVTLVKNGVDTALVASYSGTSTRTNSDNTHTVSVVAGDLVYLRLDLGAANNTSRLFAGVNFTPTINGESVQMVSPSVTLSTGVSQFFHVGGGNNAGSATESTRNNSLGDSSVWAKKLTARLTVAPGVGKSETFRVRTSFSNTVLATTIIDTNTTNSNTSDVVPLVPMDAVSLQATPTGTPATSNGSFSYVTFIDPALSPITEQGTLMAMSVGAL